MAYSSQVLSRARQILAQRKADHESKYNHDLMKAYAQVPRLREIDLELRRTMALAAKAAFMKGGDAETAMEQARTQNLALQAEREALVRAKFSPDALDETPLCPHCGGNGYVGSTMCGCLQELCRQEQCKELARLTSGGQRFDAFRLDYYPAPVDPALGVSPRKVMERNLEVCKRYAREFSGQGENLLFVGGTGLGKTFLSACIARTVADNGYSVMYESAGHLFANLERAKFSGDEQARKESDRYFACDLLIVDDLGTEMPGQFTTAALYGLINDRLLAGKPTIISTNLTIEEFERRYNRQIASRLRGSYVRVPFVGEDIRVQKNRGL